MRARVRKQEPCHGYLTLDARTMPRLSDTVMRQNRQCLGQNRQNLPLWRVHMVAQDLQPLMGQYVIHQICSTETSRGSTSVGGLARKADKVQRGGFWYG